VSPRRTGCAEVSAALAEFAFGTLDGKQRAEVVDHIDHCAGCRQRADALAATVNELAVLAPPLEPSAGFEQRTIAAMLAATPGMPNEAAAAPLATPGAAATTGRSRTHRRRFVLAAAALALIVAGAGIGTWRALDHDPAPATATRSMAMIGTLGYRIGSSTLTPGNPPIVTVTVRYALTATSYELQGLDEHGTVITLGPLERSGNEWRWSGPIRTSDVDVRVLRVVGPSGEIACQGQMPS
jgi:Putative zinc-finger